MNEPKEALSSYGVGLALAFPNGMTSLFLLVALALFSKPCQAADSKIRIGVSEVNPRFDPAKVINHTQKIIAGIIHKKLVKRDEMGFMQADLAKSWAFSTARDWYSFCVPPAKFHDGRTLTLSDIEYSFMRHMQGKGDPVYGSIIKDWKPTFSLLGGREREFCFKISFRKSVPDFLLQASFPEFVILPKDYDANSPVGLGPYKVEHISLDKTYVRLSKDNPKQNGPTFIELRKIDEDDAAQAIRSGIADVYFGSRDYQRISAYSDDIGITVIPVSGFSHMFYNMKNELFQNRDFRSDFSRFITQLVNDHHKPKRVLQRQSTLVSKGLLFADYYNRTPKAPIHRMYFVNTWKSLLNGKNFRIFSTLNHFNAEILAELSRTLHLMGARMTYSYDYSQYSSVLENRNYDLLLAGRSHSEPGLMRFVEAIDPRLDDSLSNAPIASQMEAIDKVYLDRKLDRPTKLKRIGLLLKEIEDQDYFLSLFSTGIAVLHAPDVVVPVRKHINELDILRISR